jgi:hypothetical protein
MTVNYMLCVAGCVIVTEAGELNVKVLTHNTVFIQEKDAILTNDKWRIVVDLDVKFYESTVTELRADLQEIYSLKSRYAPINELRQVEQLLTDVEHEISLYRSMLPRMSRKRGILNIAGTALKVLFGTATEHDVKTVQNAMIKVNEKQENLMHFVNEQTTT